MAFQTASSTSQQSQMKYETLLDGPAGTPPAGVVPNFASPPNLHIYINLTISLCFIFATLACFIRMYTRMVLLRSVGYDDYFSVMSWICFTGSLVSVILAQGSGLGTHMWDIKLKTSIRLSYLQHISTILYGINVCLIKTSILLQYQRIFVIHKTSKSPVFVAIQFCIWIIFLFYFMETFFDIFLCSPQEKIWNPLLTGGHCYDTSIELKVTGVFNSISDFALLLIPMPALWQLQMPLKRKLLTTGVFAAGVLACLASALRTYYTWVVHRDTDKSYSLVSLNICAAAELAIGIMVGCLPIMPKFLQYASVKVAKALPFTSKPTSKSGQEFSQDFQGQRNTPKANALTSMKRSFAKYKAGADVTDSWSDLYDLRAQNHGDYLTLTEFGAPSLQATESLQPCAGGGGIATRREDLEHGP